MKIRIELPQAQADKLREQARRFGVQPEELAAAAVVDLLNREDAELQAAAEYVLEKNRELYRRLGGCATSAWRR